MPKEVGHGPRVYKYRKTAYIPENTFGECTNVRNCKSFNVDLADGLCVTCWDKGTNGMFTFKRKARNKCKTKKN